MRLNHYILFSITYPLYLMLRFHHEITKNGFIIAGALIVIELLIVAGIYLARERWSQWMERQISYLKAPLGTPIEDMIQLVETVVFAFLMLVFGVLLPFQIYLRQEMDAIDILVMITFSTIIWLGIFYSPLHTILTGDSWTSRRLQLPVFTLLALPWLLFFSPLSGHSTHVAPVILFIFFADILGSLWLHRLLNQRGKM